MYLRLIFSVRVQGGTCLKVTKPQKIQSHVPRKVQDFIDDRKDIDFRDLEKFSGKYRLVLDRICVYLIVFCT
jgi:hypothetical protein